LDYERQSSSNYRQIQKIKHVYRGDEGFSYYMPREDFSDKSQTSSEERESQEDYREAGGLTINSVPHLTKFQEHKLKSTVGRSKQDWPKDDAALNSDSVSAPSSESDQEIESGTSSCEIMTD